MGCYNGTCGITQLPITYGTPTVNLVLVQSPFADNSPHPVYSGDGGWNVIPIPFYGKYNDYGWQEDDEGQQYKYDFLQEYFAKDIILNGKEAERKEFVDKDLISPFANSESLGRSIHGDFYGIKNHIGLISQSSERIPALKLSNMLILRSVWDTLTSGIEQDYPKVKWHTKESMVDFIVKFLEERKKLFENERVKLEGDSKRIAFLDMMEYDSIAGNRFNTEALDITFKSTDQDASYSNPFHSLVYFLLERSISSGTFHQISPFEVVKSNIITISDFVSVFLILRAMSVLRKPIIPQVGGGSQTGIEKQHQMLIEVMAKVIENEGYEDDE